MEPFIKARIQQVMRKLFVGQVRWLSSRGSGHTWFDQSLTLKAPARWQVIRTHCSTCPQEWQGLRCCRSRRTGSLSNTYLALLDIPISHFIDGPATTFMGITPF